MEVVVEVIEQGRKAPSIKRFNQSSILIGRAWDSDLVIADAEVDGHHLKLEIDSEAEQLHIEDLNSANGIRVRGHKTTPNTIAYGDEITIGQTIIRVHRRIDAVAPAKIHSRTELALKKLGAPVTALLVSIVGIIGYQFVSYMQTAAPFKWENQIQGVLFIAIGTAAWALVWGGITKLLKHRMAFWMHLGLISAVGIFALLMDRIVEFIAFNTLSPSVVDVLEALGISAMIFVWTVLGFLITTHLKVKTRVVIASSLVGLFLLSSVVIPRIGREESVSRVPLHTSSLPPSLLLADERSEDEFLSLVTDSVAKAAEAATKAKQEQAEKEGGNGNE